MKKNIFIKTISSLPMILISMYFAPIIGIVLMILRTILKDNLKKISDAVIMISIGILIIVPKWISIMCEYLKINIGEFNSYIGSNIYILIYKYGTLLITFGVIYLIILIIYNKLSNKIKTSMNSYISEQQKIDYKINKENNLKIKEQQERAKNAKVIKCPYCGASNIIHSNIGICKYCRKEIK